MAVFDLIIRATRARQGAQEFAAAGRQVTSSAREASSQVDKLDKEMDRVGPSSKRAGDGLGSLTQRARGTSSALSGLTKITAGYFGAFAAFRAVSSAVTTITNFERATVQAAKAADISTTNMRGFREEMTRISTIKGIEQRSTELAEIAAVASTLGVRGTGNLTRFTETTAKLTSSLRGLAAEDVATGMGRILQITGEGADGVERFGNVFARLEDNVAGGASAILNTSKEVALATARFNVSSTDVLALGAAFTDIGVQSELARSTLTQTLGAISTSLVIGGEKAELFAELTGQSVEGLRKSFSSDAAGTFIRFARGLGAAADEGREASLILDDLGLSGNRLEPVLTTLAERTEVLSRARAIANEEAKNQVKLDEDTSKAADTLSARFAQVRAELDAFATQESSGGVVDALKAITDQTTDLVRALRGADTTSLLGDLVRISTEKSQALVGGVIEASLAAIGKSGQSAAAANAEIAETYREITRIHAELNEEQKEFFDRQQKLHDNERQRVAELNKPAKDAVSAGREDLAKFQEEEAKKAEAARKETIQTLIRQQEDREKALERLREFNADLRKEIELANSELSGTDSAGLRQEALVQEIDAQVGAMLRLGVSGTEIVASQEESVALAQELTDILREQEAKEVAIAAQKNEQAALASERAKAEREVAQAIERQRREQERAIATVNKSLGDARFEGSIAGLSSDDQQRARELSRFTEQANEAFGPGSTGATSAIGDFKAALDFRDQQQDIRELSDAIAGDLTGSVRGLSAAFADGKVTGQEFNGILLDIVGSLAETVTQQLVIDPLTEQLSNGISGLLSGLGSGAPGSTDATGTTAGGIPTDATTNAGGVDAAGIAAALGGGGGGSGGLAGLGSVGTMTVQAATVIVNGGAGGAGGPGGSGGGLDLGGIVSSAIGGGGGGGGLGSAAFGGGGGGGGGGLDLGALIGGISSGNGGLLPSGTSVGAGIPSGSFLGAPAGGVDTAAFDQQMFASVGVGEQPSAGAQVGGAVAGSVGNIAGAALGNAIVPGLGIVLGPLIGSLLSGLFDDGGLVPGAPRGDDRMIGVGGGEFVVNADATSQFRGDLEAINSGREPRRKAVAVGGGGGTSVVNFTINTPNADSFRREQGQLVRRQEREDRRQRR